MSHLPIIICAACDFPAKDHGSPTGIVHTYPDGFKVECFRLPETIGFASWYSERNHREYSDYVLDSAVNEHSVTLLPIDVSGPEARTLSMETHSEDEFDYEDYSIELAKLDRWNDGTHYVSSSNQQSKESWVSTSLLGEPTGEYRLTVTKSKDGSKSYSKEFLRDSEVSSEQRNAYVEGNEGFLSIQLLDEALTEKYHRRLLNVFFDKDANLRVGSVRLTGNITSSAGTTGWIKASCVRNDCSGVLWVNVNTATREEQEQFIWAVISHGNNHAAKWFTNRPEFYELQPQLSEPVLTDDEVVSFLMEHNSLCRDLKCGCSDRLAELVPALNSTALKDEENKHLEMSAI